MTQPAPAQPGQSVLSPPPPPQDSSLVRQIAAALLIGASIAATVTALTALLAPLGLGAKAVGAATRLALSLGGLTVDPTGLPGSPIQADRSQGKASSNTREAEVYYRAAYLLNAAKRIERSLAGDKSLVQAIRDERRYYLQHRDAQSRRAEAARQVDVAAQSFGPLLGWYSVNDSRSSPECKAADGKNFPADRRPAIGYPGTTHPHCRCRAGLPFKNGAMLPLSRRPPNLIRKVA